MFEEATSKTGRFLFVRAGTERFNAREKAFTSSNP